MSTAHRQQIWKRLGSGAIALALLACASGEGSAPTAADAPPPEQSEAAASEERTEAADEADGTAETASAEPASSGDAELAAIEATILEQINEYRQEQGLAPLNSDGAIQQQAQQHSSAMAQGTSPVSHDGFDARVEAIAKSIDYRSAAENVAYNEGYASPGEQAVQGWLESPGHLENIRGDYNLTGIGVSRDGRAYYFTQIFILTP
ncbi:MAG: CAP domain-containing protein [Elainellaceae cyanobacterium]